MELTILSFAMFCAGVSVLWRQGVPGRTPAFIASAAGFIYLALAGVWFAADRLSGAGINEAVLYHLFADKQGAGVSEFSGLMVSCIIYLLGISAASIWWHLRIRQASNSSGGKGTRRYILTGMAALLLALSLNPAVVDIATLLQVRSSAGTDAAAARLPESFASPEHANIRGAKKNIVVVYLESVERTYFDEKLFPGLMPNLKELEKRALSFTRVGQTEGAGWTIAGMVASQCGVPLFTPGYGNSMSGVDRFLPGARAVGDLLSDEGYVLNYLGGAGLDFGGKGKFYTSHGFDRVEGYDELIKHLHNREYTSPWGLYDDTLFDIAKQRYKKLAAQSEPFGLFMLTLDTHHPKGHMPSSCAGTVYGDGEEPMLNAVHCADRLAGDFIRFVLSSEEAADTTLVVLSDHLALPNTVYPRLKSEERHNLFMVFDRERQGRKIATAGTTLDVGATLLDIMGAEIDGLGFGRSLLAEGAPLFENTAELDAMLQQQRGFIMGLWDFAQIGAGITADMDKRELKMGTRTIGFPALIMLDEELQVSGIRFEFDNPTPLAQQITTIDPLQPVLWVDECSKVCGAAPDIECPAGDFCMFAGALGNETPEIYPVQEGFSVDAEQLSEVLLQPKEEDIFLARREKSENLKRYGTANVESLAFDGGNAGTFLLKSAGGPDAGKSTIENLELGRKTTLKRGLTLVGLNKDRAPEKIAHVDSCGQTVTDSVGLQGTLAEVMDRHAGHYDVFVVAAHDSVRGKPYPLEELFAGSGLQRWEEISFRQPYVAVVAPDGETREFLAPAETVLAVKTE